MVDFAALGSLLARSLGLTGKVAVLTPDRLWRLGRTPWRDTPRDVLFARGLHWSDGPASRSKISRAHKPIVLVPHLPPPSEFWKTAPPVLDLSQVATGCANGIEIDPLEVSAAIHSADAAVANTLSSLLTREELVSLIRQEMKSVTAIQLNDDIYLQAYRQEGTVRAAAAWLSEKTGEEVSKDAVQRALTRCGGAAAALRSTSSNSVVRRDASHRRDKHGKQVIESQHDS
jgi:hypothetical protein